MSKELSRQRFDHLRCCVIIPTYNNAATLSGVISGVLAYTSNIIVVNDGSTDSTAAILNAYPGIIIVTHSVNKGKGIALQTGFKTAVQNGFRYAITIDSDGQHFPEDLPAFLDKVELVPDSIIVGARNMDQSSVPGKSSFGHKFSNFWFSLETGIDLPDTQSGYRLYPVEKINGIKWLTSKYEFEIEVLVRAAWKGIPVLSVPVKVFYAPVEERVSHFRPFRDFSRVSVLNTVLVIITLVYIWPRNFFRIFEKKNLRKFILNHLLNPEETNKRKILSVSFGVFMGIFPVWGYQLLIGLALCHFLKLNKALFVVAANISIPPMIPLIIFLSHWTGGLVFRSENPLSFDYALSFDAIKNELPQYFTGAVLLSFAAAAVTAAIAFLVVKFVPVKNLNPAFRND